MPSKNNTSNKLSNKTSALQRKWQQKAEALSGIKGIRIVTQRDEAKMIIFDTLKDAFHPMNISEIYTTLKGVIPDYILNKCLEEMALNKNTGDPFARENGRDDEDTETEDEGPINNTKAIDKYKSSLLKKVGRNNNTTLYYVNYNKLENNGNGLVPEERNILIAAVQKSDLEKQTLLNELKKIDETTKKLLSEPTNKETDVMIEAEERNINTMKESIESLRTYAVNEITRKKIIKRIDEVSSQWRKRRKICTDFLILMEESTDGTVSMKKCLAGAGQVYLEGDEFAIKEAITSAKYKKQKYKRSKHDNQASIEARPTETFLGVKLDSLGKVTRVHLDEHL